MGTPNSPNQTPDFEKALAEQAFIKGWPGTLKSTVSFVGVSGGIGPQFSGAWAGGKGITQKPITVIEAPQLPSDKLL